jgi:hypothetical protein
VAAAIILAAIRLQSPNIAVTLPAMKTGTISIIGCIIR